MKRSAPFDRPGPPYPSITRPAAYAPDTDNPFNVRPGLSSYARALESAALPTGALSIAAGLEPYTDPLDARRVAHLLRRTRFGTRAEDVAAQTGMDAAALVDALVDEALAAPLPEPPPWANTAPPPRGSSDAEFDAYFQENIGWHLEYRVAWMQELRTGGLREKMTLFWSNHFVTQAQKYFLAPFSYQYATLLRTHALGNFRDFVHAVGLDPAMLIYLDGTLSNADAPNENYARELLELFTMGPEDALGNANYTEDDIQEIARALTGWITDYFTLASYFIPFFHDTGEKTFMGRAGAFGYDDVVTILFEERAEAIAHFVCRKLYREFVYAVPDEAVVVEMAALLLSSGWEIAPVVRALLKSAHFFDEQVIGAGIKSPVALLAGALTELQPDIVLGEDTQALLPRVASFMEQELFDPPNVAGWPGHHNWVTTTTLPIRWLVLDFIVYSIAGDDGIDLVPLAAQLHDPSDPEAAFHLPLALAAHLMPVPPDALDIGHVDGAFTGNLEANPIPEEILNGPDYVVSLVKLFLDGTPWYEWYLYANGTNVRLRNFVRYLVQLPEFQLT